MTLDRYLGLTEVLILVIQGQNRILVQQERRCCQRM